MNITIPQAARRLRPGATRRRLAAAEQALASLRSDLLLAEAAANKVRANGDRIDAIAKALVVAFRFAGRPVPEVLVREQAAADPAEATQQQRPESIDWKRLARWQIDPDHNQPN